MGLFSQQDQKEPDYILDESQEGPVLKYIRTYTSKFFTIMACNFLFLLVNIPMIMIAYVIVFVMIPLTFPSLSLAGIQEVFSFLNVASLDQAVPISDAVSQLHFFVMLFVALILVGFSMIVFGPFQTALSYVFRNYARGTAGFFWQDFMRSFKENWKKSTAAMCISIAVTIVLLLNIGFYSSMYTGKFAKEISVAFTVLSFLVVCMQMYIYPMIASLELPLRKIYKNAILFTMARILPTIGIITIQSIVLLVIPAMMVLLGSKIGTGMAIVYYFGFAFSFVFYLSNFFVWRQIERFIVIPQQLAAEEAGEPIEELDDTKPDVSVEDR
jgi:uncharacterized membrane protein YesL